MGRVIRLSTSSGAASAYSVWMVSVGYEMSGSKFSARRSSEMYPNRLIASRNIETVTGRLMAPLIIGTEPPYAAGDGLPALSVWRDRTLILPPSFNAPWPATTTLCPGRDSVADLDDPFTLVSEFHLGPFGGIVLRDEDIVLAVLLDQCSFGNHDCVRFGIRPNLHTNKGAGVENPALD